MQFESGDKIIFTASEAHWAQEHLRSLGRPASTVARISRSMAERILAARIAFAAPHLPPESLEAVRRLPTYGANMETLYEFHRQMKDLHKLERKLGSDEAGVERHIIGIAINRDEQRLLYALARTMHEGAVEDATRSDAPDELLGPEDPAMHGLAEAVRDMTFNDSLLEINVTRGIMNAIEKQIAQN